MGGPVLLILQLKRIALMTEDTYMIELADVRNTLENTATKLADFRGSL